MAVNVQWCQVSRTGAYSIQYQIFNTITSSQAPGSSTRVTCHDSLVSATPDRYVLALGSFSPQTLKPLGIKAPVYPLILVELLKDCLGQHASEGDFEGPVEDHELHRL